MDPQTQITVAWIKRPSERNPPTSAHLPAMYSEQYFAGYERRNGNEGFLSAGIDPSLISPPVMPAPFTFADHSRRYTGARTSYHPSGFRPPQPATFCPPHTAYPDPDPSRPRPHPTPRLATRLRLLLLPSRPPIARNVVVCPVATASLGGLHHVPIVPVAIIERVS